MKYKTAFRLALRAIGVLLVFQQLPQLATTGAAIVGSLLAPPPTPGVLTNVHDTCYFIYQPQLIGNIVGLVSGVYLFFGGAWIVNRAIPSNRPYCADCGYELTGLGHRSRCPECGAEPTVARAVRRSEPPS